MRTHSALLALCSVISVGVSACSLEYEVSASDVGPTAYLTPDEPTKTFNLKICVSGSEFAEELWVTIRPWSPDAEADLVLAKALGVGETLGPRSNSITHSFYLTDIGSFEDACSGFDVTFDLDGAATGEVAVEWDIEVTASGPYEELEAESIELEVVS